MGAKSEHFKFQGAIFSGFTRKKTFIKLFPEGTLLLIYFKKRKLEPRAALLQLNFLMTQMHWHQLLDKEEIGRKM